MKDCVWILPVCEERRPLSSQNRGVGQGANLCGGHSSQIPAGPSRILHKTRLDLVDSSQNTPLLFRTSPQSEALFSLTGCPDTLSDTFGVQNPLNPCQCFADNLDSFPHRYSARPKPCSSYVQSLVPTGQIISNSIPTIWPLGHHTKMVLGLSRKHSGINTGIPPGS